MEACNQRWPVVSIVPAGKGPGRAVVVQVHRFEVVLSQQGICWQLAMLKAGQGMHLFEQAPLVPSCCSLTRSSAHEHKRCPAARLPAGSAASSLFLSYRSDQRGFAEDSSMSTMSSI